MADILNVDESKLYTLIMELINMLWFKIGGYPKVLILILV